MLALSRCDECGAQRGRCMCAARRAVHLAAAEYRALERIAENARALVLLARLRGEHVDGMIGLLTSLDNYDEAVAKRVENGRR